LSGWLTVCLVLFATSRALAQSGDGYDVSWRTVAGGGRISITAGAYSLDVTIGQPEAGLVAGGGLTVTGGFLPGGEVTAEYRIHIPLVLR
jgi:hypothetical protein